MLTNGWGGATLAFSVEFCVFIMQLTFLYYLVHAGHAVLDDSLIVYKVIHFVGQSLRALYPMLPVISLLGLGPWLKVVAALLLMGAFFTAAILEAVKDLNAHTFIVTSAILAAFTETIYLERSSAESLMKTARLALLVQVVAGTVCICGLLGTTDDLGYIRYLLIASILGSALLYGPLYIWMVTRKSSADHEACITDLIAPPRAPFSFIATGVALLTEVALQSQLPLSIEFAIPDTPFAQLATSLGFVTAQVATGLLALALHCVWHFLPMPALWDAASLLAICIVNLVISFQAWEHAWWNLCLQVISRAALHATAQRAMGVDEEERTLLRCVSVVGSAIPVAMLYRSSRVSTKNLHLLTAVLSGAAVVTWLMGLRCRLATEKQGRNERASPLQRT